MSFFEIDTNQIERCSWRGETRENREEILNEEDGRIIKFWSILVSGTRDKQRNKKNEWRKKEWNKTKGDLIHKFKHSTLPTQMIYI